MSVDVKTVQHVAHLARLTLTPEGAVAMTAELNAVLDWGMQLAEVNTDEVEPMVSPVHGDAPMRADIVNDGNCREAVLANAPLTEEGFFLVPKMVE